MSYIHPVSLLTTPLPLGWCRINGLPLLLPPGDYHCTEQQSAEEHDGDAPTTLLPYGGLLYAGGFVFQ